MMPPDGAAAHGDQSATLETISHERLTDPALGRLLDALEPWAAGEDPDSDAVRLIRELRRDFEKAVRVPTGLAAEASRAAALGQAAWMEARAAADFGRFRDALAHQLELRHRYVACFDSFAHPYDALLDDFEPGMTVAQVEPLLDELAEGLVPLVADAAGDAGPRAARSAVRTSREDQRRLRRGDPRGGRLRLRRRPARHRRRTRSAPGSAPATAGSPPATTPHDFSRVFFGILHEVGHGLYEQGLDPEHFGTPLGEAVSLGIHESQSRLWENLVGRSRPFWEHFSRAPAESSPAASTTSRSTTSCRAINDVRAVAHPRRGRRGDLQPAHHPALRARAGADRRRPGRRPTCPRAWNEKCRELLGLTPPDDAAGLPAGHPLERRADRLLPDLHARQPVRRPAVGDAPRRPARPRRAARAGRLRAPAGVAGGQHPPPRPQVPARRAAPARDRPRARGRAVPRVPRAPSSPTPASSAQSCVEEADDAPLVLLRPRLEPADVAGLGDLPQRRVARRARRSRG